MKWLILAAIRAYWRLRPARLKGRCLFRESCSLHVFKITKNRGFGPGIKAMITRAAICRPGYHITTCGGTLGILAKNGRFVPEPELANHVLAGTSMQIATLESQLSQAPDKPSSLRLSDAVSKPSP